MSARCPTCDGSGEVAVALTPVAPLEGADPTTVLTVVRDVCPTCLSEGAIDWDAWGRFHA